MCSYGRGEASPEPESSAVRLVLSGRSDIRTCAIAGGTVVDPTTNGPNRTALKRPKPLARLFSIASRQWTRTKTLSSSRLRAPDSEFALRRVWGSGAAGGGRRTLGFESRPR